MTEACQGLLQDVRYSSRVLAKNPAFAAIAILTLGLGIAANTTIFSWISATILDPVPGAWRTGELVTVMRGERSEHPTPPFSYPDYVDLRERSESFSGLLAYHDEFVSLTGTGKPERTYGALTSANYFEVLGVRPILGSVFLPAEEEKPGRTPSIIISHGLWQRRFGGDSLIVGKPIQLNRQLCTVVGVAPPGFQGCKSGLRTDLWAPLVYRGAQVNERGSFWLNVLGRLKPGVDRRQVEVELDIQMRRVAEQFPDSHRGPNQITLDPLWRSPFGANVYLYKTLPMLLALAAVLLLLACANVANLLLVHSVARRREIAIRLSLGASRPRLIRQLLVESLMLALAGGALAMLFTFWTAGTFACFIPPADLPIALNGRADRSVLIAAFAISLLTAVIFGTLPAFRASRLAPVKVLKEEGGSVSAAPHKSRLTGALVAAVGIYGVVDYRTRQRTREIGIRMALGAKPGEVFRLVLGQGLKLSLVGLTAGLALSLVLARFLRSMLFGVTEMDGPTIASVSVLLCAVALAACYAPAHRAAKAHPIQALRYE